MRRRTHPGPKLESVVLRGEEVAEHPAPVPTRGQAAPDATAPLPVVAGAVEEGLAGAGRQRVGLAQVEGEDLVGAEIEGHPAQ